MCFDFFLKHSLKSYLMKDFVFKKKMRLQLKREINKYVHIWRNVKHELLIFWFRQNLNFNIK
jgi:hypothetical protein